MLILSFVHFVWKFGVKDNFQSCLRGDIQANHQDSGTSGCARGRHESLPGRHPVEASDGYRMSLFGPLQTGCLVAFALLLLLAAWQDLRTMHIADAVSLAIVVAFAVWALSGLVRGTQSFTAIGLALACAAVVFGAGRRSLRGRRAGRRRREIADRREPVRRPRSD
ncbi:MAG TPA: hypothetical protein VI232_10560, partial [Reyranella sp.]